MIGMIDYHVIVTHEEAHALLRTMRTGPSGGIRRGAYNRLSLYIEQQSRADSQSFDRDLIYGLVMHPDHVLALLAEADSAAEYRNDPTLQQAVDDLSAVLPRWRDHRVE